MNAEARLTGGRDGLEAAVGAEINLPLYEAPLSERHVIGSALLGYRAGLDRLHVDRDLTDPRLRAVAHAVRRLDDRQAPVDVPAVWHELQADADVRWTAAEPLGNYLAELVDVDTCPIPASAGWHARIVRECTARRRMHKAAAVVDDLAAGSLDDVMVTTQTMIDEVLAVAADLKRVSSQ